MTELGAGSRFLVVDDDEAFRTIMERSLKRRGFEVSQAADGATALEMAASFSPQVILLDLNMPGPSGLLTLPGLLRAAPDARVIILTGYSSVATAVEAIKLGAEDYLCKPATVEEIITTLQGGLPPADVREAPLSVERLEWEHIQKVLQQQGGNISATAKALGMHRRTLQRKLAKRPVRE